MYMQEFASDIRIINVTSGATATPIRNLVQTVLDGLSGDAKVLPRGSVIGVILKVSVDVGVQDALSGLSVIISAGTRHEFPVLNALDKLKLINAATVNVEIYFGRP